MDFGRTLRYCRRRAGLTQRQVAACAGIPQPAVARIESGRVVPRADTFERLLAACDFAVELRAAPSIDRSTIRQLLKLTPRERLELAGAEANNLARLGVT